MMQYSINDLSVSGAVTFIFLLEVVFYFSMEKMRTTHAKQKPGDTIPRQIQSTNVLISPQKIK